MKSIKLNQDQLRSLIEEAMQSGPVPGNPDAEMGRQLAQTFTMMLSPEPQMLTDLANEMTHLLVHKGDMAFFPERIEDIDRMSYAAAREAAQRIANSSDFIDFLGTALARAYRKSM